MSTQEYQPDGQPDDQAADDAAPAEQLPADAKPVDDDETETAVDAMVAGDEADAPAEAPGGTPAEPGQ